MAKKKKKSKYKFFDNFKKEDFPKKGDVLKFDKEKVKKFVKAFKGRGKKKKK